MNGILEIIDDATLNWLLEKTNPSVRYFTQTKLLGFCVDHPEVVESKRKIMTTGLVPKILDKQLPNTYNGRMLYKVEVKGANSKWITLRAVNVLHKF